MSPSILDPSLDVVFKLLLTSGPDSHEVLIALLTAVLRPRKPFEKVTVRNPEIARELLDDRGVVLDIFAELEDGTRLDIEMQSERRPSFRRRALYYWARMFGSELERGDDYGQLRPAISVLFLGYRELAGARVHSTFRLLEVHDHERFTDEIELHVIELPKLALATSEEQRDEAKMLAWAKFFAAKSDEEMTEAAMSDSAVEKAHKVLQRVSSDPAARRLAEQRALALVTLKIDFDEIKREGEAIGIAKGEALGIAKGEALGIAKGEALGIAKGEALGIAKGEALGIAKGEALGIAKGEALGIATARAAVVDLCEVLGIELTNEHREQLATLSLAELEALRLAIKRDRRWP